MSYDVLRVVDIETSGADPAEHAIVEIACLDVETNPFIATNPQTTLVNPRQAIPPEASAVHHLMDDDVAKAPDAREVVAPMLEGEPTPTALVAHKADFEAGFLGNYFAGIPWICTMKCAMRVWPEAPGFSNQVLRYWLGLGRLWPANTSPTHRALPDCFVTAGVLGQLLKHATVEQMIAWSKEPPLMPRIPFGKHKGKSWSELPHDYLIWMTKKADDLDEDAKWNAQRELDRRAADKAAAARPPPSERHRPGDSYYNAPIVDENSAPAMSAADRRTYAATACAVVQMVASLEGLDAWWRSEAENRVTVGAVKGTEEFDLIVAACAKRKAELQPPTTQEAA